MIRYILLSSILQIAILMQAQDFVQVEGDQFIWQSKPYYFMGTNFWYGMNLASSGEGGDRERLLPELDHLKALGPQQFADYGQQPRAGGCPLADASYLIALIGYSE